MTRPSHRTRWRRKLKRAPFGKRWYPDQKPTIKPGLICPKCTILGCFWIYANDGFVRCYQCGYPLPERYEEPLSESYEEKYKDRL